MLFQFLNLAILPSISLSMPKSGDQSDITNDKPGLRRKVSNLIYATGHQNIGKDCQKALLLEDQLDSKDFPSSAKNYWIIYKSNQSSSSSIADIKCKNPSRNQKSHKPDLKNFRKWKKLNNKLGKKARFICQNGIWVDKWQNGIKNCPGQKKGDWEHFDFRKFGTVKAYEKGDEFSRVLW